MDLDDIPVHSSAPVLASSLAEHRAHEHSNTQPRVSSSTSHDHAAAAAAAAYALPFQTGAASASSSNSRGFDDPAHYGHDEAFAQLIQRAIRMGEGAAAGPPPPPPPPASTSSVAAAAAAAIAAVAHPQKPQYGATRDPAQVHLELIRKRLEAAEKPTTEKGLGDSSKEVEDGQVGEMGAATVETGPATTTSPTLTAAAAPLGAARSPSSQSPLPATTPTTAATATATATAAIDGTTTTTTTSNTPTTSKPGRGPGSRARWTPAEDRKLVQFVHYSDPPLTWDEIGAKMGRAATGCSMRWYKYLRDKSTPPAANQRASPAAATASGEGAAERMTSTAASGDEEASRVDASGHHHDKGKGKETASTPAAPSGPAPASDDVLDPNLYLQVAQEPQPQPQPQPQSQSQSQPEQQQQQQQHAPSNEMVVGGSSGQEQQQQDDGKAVAGQESIREGGQSPQTEEKATKAAGKGNGAKAPRKASAIATGRLVDIPYISPDQLPPPLPPAPDLPGHPFPRDPTTRVHSNAGQHYLLKTALVENPPIPFKKNTIVRGRRTKPIEDLQEEMQRELEKQKAEREAKRQEFLAKAIKEMNESGQANQPEMNDETYQAYMRGEGPPPRGTALMQIVPTGKGRPTGPGARGGTSKGGTTVHTCPAENCTAAFKRSEHLRRHYKSVHRGEKPFPCTVAGCGKMFSRKDNLQQHQAMVHYVRALYHYPDGTSSVDPPEPGQTATITFEAVDITHTSRGAKKMQRAKNIQSEILKQSAEDEQARAAAAADGGVVGASTTGDADGPVKETAAAPAVDPALAPAVPAGASGSEKKRGPEDDTSPVPKGNGRQTKRQRQRYVAPAPAPAPVAAASGTENVDHAAAAAAAAAAEDDNSMLDPALQALAAQVSAPRGMPTTSAGASPSSAMPMSMPMSMSMQPQPDQPQHFRDLLYGHPTHSHSVVASMPPAAHHHHHHQHRPDLVLDADMFGQLPGFEAFLAAQGPSTLEGGGGGDGGGH
ncbi:hypothetical protein JCM8115_000774 [Rhodotorula mucilaginosa]